tara:strand:- start:2509 stop:2931 length:423 start_codon:yes stop_codon:yes gene_type:complete
MKNPLKVKSNIAKKVIDYGASLLRKPKKTAPLTKKQDVYKQGMVKTGIGIGVPAFAAGMYVASDGKKPAPKKSEAKPVTKKKSKTVKLTPDQMPKAKPKKKIYMKEKYTGKDSNVEFKPLSGGGKVGGMKIGPATPNRLY